ncbi:hypothetical protein NE555_17300, partial [Alistipes onderdonkii]|uniref:hypothetical protein n=1 Tax=Alistipes onderdonkii TaxID=328813 RepID=UPI00210D38BB
RNRPERRPFCGEPVPDPPRWETGTTGAGDTSPATRGKFRSALYSRSQRHWSWEARSTEIVTAACSATDAGIPLLPVS